MEFTRHDIQDAAAAGCCSSTATPRNCELQLRSVKLLRWRRPGDARDSGCAPDKVRETGKYTEAAAREKSPRGIRWP
jgi:hypothetical protein